MKLNKRQRWAVFTGFLVASVMGLFPPYIAEIQTSKGGVHYMGAGYAFIFSRWPNNARVDVTRLGSQWAAVGLGMVGTVFLMGGNKNGTKGKSDD